jgi:competence protein ComGC
MDIAILIGVIIFLFIMYMYGCKKGFVFITLSLAMSLVAFVLSLMLAKPLENFIKDNTKIDDKINSKMEKYVDKYIEKEMDMASIELQKDSINELKLPSSIREKLIKNNTADIRLNMGVESFSEYIAKSLTDILMSSLAMMILFIAIRILLRVIITVANLITRLPIIRTVNKTLGGIIGLAEGIIVIWIAAIVVTALGATAMGSNILEAISSNEILNFIYNNNLLLNLMQTF